MWKMPATRNFGGSHQDWQFIPGKKVHYIGNQEEVQDGSSWSARSSHFVVEPLLPTRSLFKQTCLRLLLWRVKCERCLQHVTLEDLIKTGNLFPERKYIILGIRKKSKMDQVGQLGVPTSWLSPYCQQEVYSSRPVWDYCCDGWNVKDACNT